MKLVFFPLCAGDALSSLKALRDAGRFVGKEDTVPLRLLYSRHNHSQITQDELSTRVKASPGSTQVHGVFSVVRMERERERGVSAVCTRDAFRKRFRFPHVYVCIVSSPPLPLSSEGKLTIRKLQAKQKKPEAFRQETAALVCWCYMGHRCL